MFTFRSAIRRLFGIFIPGVDATQVNGRSYYSDADVITELRSALAEAEDEARLNLLDSVIAESQQRAYREAIVDALVTLMTALGVTQVTIQFDDTDEDEFPNNVVDSY